MLILLDRKMPGAAREKLATYGNIVEFATEGITYEAISGHPDIFFCPSPGGLIVAPNLPEEYFGILDQNSIHYHKGSIPVGREYPETARYNSLVTDKFIIQNPASSDPKILKLNAELEPIHTKQGYVRCNLIALSNETYITSDRGIEKSLKQRNLEVLFVDPTGVKLDGFKNGFFGGACGLFENTLFVCGSLKYSQEQAIIESFVGRAGVSIIELFDGQPVDVGNILFL
ncbi:MAG: hypothetical protein Q7U54_19670 [Bacteroidales bacterium]|nr:hypothetical protein [Bacteroidales bacterium]